MSSPEPPVRVRYQATLALMLRPAFRGFRTRLFLWPPLVLAVMLAYGIATSPLPMSRLWDGLPANALRMAPVALGIGLAAVALIYGTVFLMVWNRFRRLSAAHRGITFEMTPETFAWIDDAGGHTGGPWSYFRRIVDAGDVLFLEGRIGSPAVLPKSAFGPGQMDVLRAFAAKAEVVVQGW